MMTRYRRGAAVVVALLLLCLGGIVALAGPAAAATTATFSASAWESGFTGTYTIANSGPGTVNGWQLQFDLPAGTQVGTFWDALMTRAGNHYTFTNRNYNGTIAVGASVSFGFVASGTGRPTNCTVNGASCGGGGTTTTTRPPTSTGPTTTGPTTTTRPPTTTGPTTTTRPPTTTSIPTTPGDIRVAPYIDITRPQPRMADVARTTSQRHFTLAFILGDSSGCNPSWGGIIPLNDPRIIGDVADLKALGGDTVVASGGAQGPYLEHVCGTASALTAAYVRTLDAVGSTHLDLDIEASINADMVNQALAALQRQRPNVKVSYTLRIQGDDFGMDPFSVQILQSAVRNGVRVDVVNIMAMNFGSSRPWGQAMIAAAESSLNQMRGVFTGTSDAALRRMLGVTPMIGRNDTGPVTRQADAQQVISWGNQNHIGFVAFWSVGRDNGGCPNGGVSPSCSGIPQSEFEFIRIFRGFSG